MNEIEILLEKEIDSDLGSRNKIEELYKNIDSNVSKVVMNFKGVEFNVVTNCSQLEKNNMDCK